MTLLCACVCVKKLEPLETHTVISMNSYNCMYSANSCIQLQGHGKKKIQHVLKYKPVFVLVCFVICCLFVQSTGNNSPPLSFSSTDGTHLPINFSDILPLWEIESPPSEHVWSDLPPGTPPLCCTDVCASYSYIGWYCPT